MSRLLSRLMSYLVLRFVPYVPSFFRSFVRFFRGFFRVSSVSTLFASRCDRPFASAVLSACILGFCLTGAVVAKTDLSDPKLLQSYAVGQSVGENIRFQELNLNQAAFLEGVQDALSDASRLTSEEMKTAIVAFQKAQYEKQRSARDAQGEVNKAEGEAFLKKNKSQKGVKTTPSGLQYKIITPGKGASPKSTDQVTVHYEGTLIDGTVFDSSFDRGEPATFPLDGVIKGWTEGLQLMKEGAEFMFYIPSDLAYGTRGAGPRIGPNSTLVFRVQLLKILP